jgi:hypothetical protein
VKIEREPAKLGAKRERIRNNADEGLYDVAQAKRRLAAVEEQSRELRALLPAPAAIDIRRVAQALAHAFAGFARRPFAEKQALLRKAFRESVVGSRTIESVTVSGDFFALPEVAKLGTRC